MEGIDMPKGTCAFEPCDRRAHTLIWCQRHYLQQHRGRRMTPHPPPDPAERFWQRVAQTTGDNCWPWMSGLDSKGYGAVRVEGKAYKAHRRAWELVNGPIPSGLAVCHRCDNPPCCNPSHLFLGTLADNNVDRKIKGRNGVGRAKVTEDQVREIRALAGSMSQSKIGVLVGLDQRAVSRILLGQTWKHVA